MTDASGVPRPAGPQADAEGAAYPPAPWGLYGNFAVGVFLVPKRQLPTEILAEVPAGARILTVAGRAIVGVAAVHYTPGGVLAYDELLVAMPVMSKGRIAVNIGQIWVTSRASQAGGRALWAIPKQLMFARRSGTGRRLTAVYHGEDQQVLAETTATATFRLPGRWRLPLPTLQRRGQSVVGSSNVVRGELHLARTEWAFGSSLSWLRGHRPVLGAAITRAAVVFGDRAR